MKWPLTLLSLLCFSSLGFSQDIRVREEAVRLLERAHLASTPAKLPDLERIDTFRAYSDSGVQEGRFSHLVIQGTGRRDEYFFGNSHLLNIWTDKQVAALGNSTSTPPEIITLTHIAPIDLVSFDGEDVIHTITDRSLSGRAAHCIQFDTVHGEKTDANEICVDASNSTLLSEKVGAELIEYSDFFPFAGALMPGKINYYLGGAQKMEVAQTLTALVDASPNVLAAPPDARIHSLCTTFRRPIGLSMPQPSPGNGGENVDVIVHGIVGADGGIHEPVVQSSERPDLNAEAVAQVQQWSFTPASCNGRPDQREVLLTVHFQGR